MSDSESISSKSSEETIPAIRQNGSISSNSSGETIPAIGPNDENIEPISNTSRRMHRKS